LGKDKGSFFVKVLSLLRSKEFRVVATGGGDHRREDRHRVSIGRKSLEVKFHIFVHQLMFCQQPGKAPQFGVRRKFSVNDHERGLDKARSLGQLLDRDTAVAKDALFPINEGDGARTGTGVSVTAVESY
jgi:hypothetical protein